MKSSAYIAHQFKVNAYALNKNLSDITNEDSIKRPLEQLNSINWIVGHLLVVRDGIFKQLGLKPQATDAMKNIYKRGEEPKEQDGNELLSITDLLAAFESTQNLILEVLENFEDSTEEKQEALKALAGFSFHESYHIGQLGILRKVLGKGGVLA